MNYRVNYVCHKITLLFIFVFKKTDPEWYRVHPSESCVVRMVGFGFFKKEIA